MIIEGNVIQNEAYKVKKLTMVIRAWEEKYKALQADFDVLKNNYDALAAKSAQVKPLIRLKKPFGRKRIEK